MEKGGIFRILRKRSSVLPSLCHVRVVNRSTGSVSLNYELRIVCRIFVGKLVGSQPLIMPNKR